MAVLYTMDQAGSVGAASSSNMAGVLVCTDAQSEMLLTGVHPICFALALSPKLASKQDPVSLEVS